MKSIEANLVIIGEGPLEGKVKQVIRDLNLQKKITTGLQDVLLLGGLKAKSWQASRRLSRVWAY